MNKQLSNLPNSITMIGRVWWQRGTGNPYSTTQVLVNGKTVHRTPKDWGRESFNEACDWLENNGFIPKQKTENKQLHWCYIRDILKINYEYVSINVRSEKEL